MYNYWLDPPVPIYMQFWMFNVTNPDEVLQKGERPSVAQYGPYTYRLVLSLARYKPRCEKTGLQGFRPGPTQIGLCN